MFVAKRKDGENIGKESLTFPTLHNLKQPIYIYIYIWKRWQGHAACIK
jgi:hypothetical protein